MKLVIIAALALLPSVAFAQTINAAPEANVVPDVAQASVQWRSNFVVAAQSFDRWVQQDSEAQAVVAFTQNHPGRTKQLIEYVLANPFGDLNGFNETHHNLAVELTKNPNGAANLISWARQNAWAARALVTSPHGFRMLAVAQN